MCVVRAGADSRPVSRHSHPRHRPTPGVEAESTAICCTLQRRKSGRGYTIQHGIPGLPPGSGMGETVPPVQANHHTSGAASVPPATQYGCAGGSVASGTTRRSYGRLLNVISKHGMPGHQSSTTAPHLELFHSRWRWAPSTNEVAQPRRVTATRKPTSMVSHEIRPQTGSVDVPLAISRSDQAGGLTRTA